MRVRFVLNRDSGTLRTEDMDAYRAEAERIFADAGHETSFDIAAGAEIDDALRRGAESDSDAMIAGGGDGTVSAAARIAWKTGTPLGVIPAGTMNLFARALGLPLDIREALPALAGAEIAAVDIGSANGTGFVHQVSVGLHPRMVRYRERYEFASRLGKVWANIRATMGVITRPPTLAAQITMDGVEEHILTSAISVSNNLFGDEPFLVAGRLDEGRLGVYTAPPMRPVQVARLAFDILRGKRQFNPDLTEGSAEALTLRFPRLRKGQQMVLDGELLPLEAEMALKIHAGALKVLRPRPVEPS